MKKLLVGLIFFCNVSYATVDGTGDPDSLEIKLYRFAVSTNSDCSNPQVVIDKTTGSSEPEYVSMLDKPEFGEGSVDNGTYPCVMIEMSDHIKFSPDGNVGSLCDGNTTYTLDVCGGGGSYTDLDGNVSTCSGDNGADPSDSRVDTKVVLYLSTASTSTSGSNAFQPPTSDSDASNGFKLASSLVVSGTEVGVFDVDGSGQVESDDSRTYCEFMPPTFSFDTK